MVTVKTEHSKELEKLFNSSVSDIRKQGHILLGRVINRAATAGNTRASVNIRKKYIVKATNVKKAIKLKKASNNRLIAELRASAPTVPLMDYDVDPKFPDFMRVSARVMKGPKKPIDSGFVVRANSGHINVYARVGDDRYSIKPFYGPSIAQMLGKEQADVMSRIQEVLDSRLEHELSRFLRGEF